MAVPAQPGLFDPPERLFVCTPSKLGSYEDCPRRYRYSYVDRPAPPKGPPWAHNSLGASVHNALRSYFDVAPAERRLALLPAFFKKTWVREGYRDVEQERTAYRQALGWLESYATEAEPDFEPYAAERTVGARTKRLALSGRVDRIDKRGDELVIIDYKTGRTGLDSDDARGSRALALYAYAAGSTFRTSVRKVELHHLPTGTVAAHEHTEASLARHLDRAERTAGDIVAAEQAVAAGADPDAAFPTRPGPICGWCDYRKTCPVGQEQPAKDPWEALERLS